MKLGPKSRGLFALVVGFGALAVAIVVSAADPPAAETNPPAANPPATTKGTPKPTAGEFRVDKPSTQVASIYSALLKDCKADFESTSLRDVFDYISDLHKVRILIDTRVVPEDTQNANITLKVSDVPLSALLERILDSQKLDWVIRDNVILVTTPRRAANLLETHYYDLSKLGRVDSTPADIVDLIGQLQEDRVPDDLNAQEQVPEATKKVLNQNNLLIVRDNRRGHEMIEKLLVAMAATAPEEPDTSATPKNPALHPMPMRLPTTPALPKLPAPQPMEPMPGATAPPAKPAPAVPPGAP